MSFGSHSGFPLRRKAGEAHLPGFHGTVVLMVDVGLVKPEDLWYLTGLIATDGNLSSDGRHIELTSKDLNHLERLRVVLSISSRVGRKSNGARTGTSFRLQIGDKQLYGFFSEVGLVPKKSLQLGALRIPPEHFRDFLRGVIDGDGSINTWVHSTNKTRQWALRVYSASPVFASWLKAKVESRFGVVGRAHVEQRAGRNPLYIIKFGKLAARVILGECYYTGCTAIPRKLEKARRCVETPSSWRRYGSSVVAGVAK